uniref:Uncharacterized protein n=2 Tax=Physcomitrium patens TaxID=3218 RepID=A0A2K1JU54_PHYPA|nr:hypothetical protein PHYPA_014834 [Physcomitrium patens]
MGSNPIPPILPLESSLTFLPGEIDYLFCGGPPVARPHVPPVAVEVENHEARAAAGEPALIAPSQAA